MTEVMPRTADTPVKRGRGRPVGWRGKYKPRKSKQPLELNELNEAQAKRPRGRPPAKPPTIRLANGQFGKGASGNPQGGAIMKPRLFSNLAIEARKIAHVALDRLEWLVTNGETHNTQLAAALAILDRGYGRPVATIDLKADIQSTAVNVIAELKPDDRRIMHETMKAITHNPAALGYVVEAMQGDEPIDAIPDDVLEPAPAP
jgi:hypothetical protein